MSNDNFVPDWTTMTVRELLRSCLNAGSIDALANTPDYELVERIEGAPALVELERRAGGRPAPAYITAPTNIQEDTK